MTQPNDPSISDDVELLRWIAPSHVVEDTNREEGFRASSAAFRDYEMSVFLSDTLAERREQAEDVVPEGKFMVSLLTRFVRDRGQGVIRSPEKGHPAHGDVVGVKTKPKRFPVAKEFAEEAVWVLPPPPDFEPPAGRR
jgi:hypothetical protein